MTPEKITPTPPQKVNVVRTELAAPDLEDPGRIIVQVQYQVGELPPHFIYINKKIYTKEKEAELIKADITKRMSSPGETISI